MALGALIAHLGTGAAWRRWLLFLLSVPVALAGNVVRITSLCVYAGLTDTTRATGVFHNIGGFVLFGFALLCLVLLKRLLRC
jgi:exosortase/archaeosortase family protein